MHPSLTIFLASTSIFLDDLLQRAPRTLVDRKQIFVEKRVSSPSRAIEECDVIFLVRYRERRARRTPERRKTRW
jgi:hypothetical protein